MFLDQLVLMEFRSSTSAVSAGSYNSSILIVRLVMFIHFIIIQLVFRYCVYALRVLEYFSNNEVLIF